MQNKLYAWLINNSDFKYSWEISRYGWGFELSYLKEGGFQYIGKVYWNETWIAVPYDGDSEGFDSFVDATKYVENFI